MHNSGWVQSPGADHLGDPAYAPVLQDYVTGVMSLFRNDDRVLGWDLWNEPDNPASVYRKVENARTSRTRRRRCFRRCSVGPLGQRRTAADQRRLAGELGRRSRSAIAGIQLDNSDVISFHCYAKPADFEARIDELAPLGRPILCTEYLARNLGSTIEGVLPIAKRRNVGCVQLGVRGR